MNFQDFFGGNKTTSNFLIISSPVNRARFGQGNALGESFNLVYMAELLFDMKWKTIEYWRGSYQVFQLACLSRSAKRFGQ